MPFEKRSHIPSNRVRIPAVTTPQQRPFRVALVYKNFGGTPSSHIGLGVSAVNTAKVLQAHGIMTDVWGINNLAGLLEKIALARAEPPNVQPVTHIVISAPWLAAEDLQDVAICNSSIQFAVTSHSNVGFLFADPRALRLIRGYADVETGTPNFHLAGNSATFTEWIVKAYNDPCWFLPNLYYLDSTAGVQRPLFDGALLKIGCFGATRPFKNIVSAGGAALEMAQLLRVDLEFHISGKRTDGGAATLTALDEMYQGVRGARLVVNDWAPWPRFRQIIRSMDLLMQPSFTESYNVVTADGIAEGVPTVASSAIDWVPDNWMADADDVNDIANVGMRLLRDPSAPAEGLTALVDYNATGVQAWLQYLQDTTPHM